MNAPSEVRVAIGIPSNGTWRDGFGWSLTDLLLWTLRQAPDLDVQVFGVSSSSIPNNRAHLVRQAIGYGASHLLFLDTDMLAPKDTLLRLLAHANEVVGAAYPTRGVSGGDCVAASDSLDTAQPLTLEQGETGLRRIALMGLGCCLLNVSIFEHVGPAAFEMRYRPELQRCEGEDYSFCRALHAHGIEVFCDMDLSAEVSHIGNMVFGLKNVLTQPTVPA